MSTALWIVYDIILGVIGYFFLERPLTRKEWRRIALLVVIGLGVAAYSGNSDYQGSKQIDKLQGTIDELSKTQAFNTGQLAALGILARQTGTNPKAGRLILMLLRMRPRNRSIDSKRKSRRSKNVVT
jgi:hypothetical protein